MKIDDSGRTTVQRSITISRPSAELYAIWRDPKNLAAILTEVVEVTATAADRAHWKMRSGVLGVTTEWDATLVSDVPGRSIEWQAEEGAALANTLRIDFAPAPGNQGSEVTLTFRFAPPGGALGETLDKMFFVPPEALIGKMLYRFRAYVQTGEIPTLRFNPSHRVDAELQEDRP